MYISVTKILLEYGGKSVRPETLAYQSKISFFNNKSLIYELDHMSSISLIHTLLFSQKSISVFQIIYSHIAAY